MANETLGQILYETVQSETQGGGRFEDLSEKEREAWRIGALRVTSASHERIAAFVKKLARNQEQKISDDLNEKDEVVWGYSESEHAEVWSGACATREEAIQEGAKELGLTEFWVRSGIRPSPSEFLPDVDFLLEHMGEAAQDKVGEAAEEFPDVSDEARDELEALLSEWADQHITVGFWAASGAPEIVTVLKEVDE